MRTLPSPTVPSAVLSFDFDGTLHHPAGDPPVPMEFFEIIQQLREQQSVIWGINTGRSMPLLVEGFLEGKFPFLPDWAVAREREIYFPNDYGRWIPHASWNDPCELEIHKLFKQSRHILAQMRKEVEDHTGAQWMELDGEPAGIISQTEEEMEWIVYRIEPIAKAEPHLSWQRNSIYLRFGHRDYQKGTSLSEVVARYGLSAAECFAIGDSHNDLEMLDPAHAAMTACPANGVPAVQDKIRATGGIITVAEHGLGSIEALRHYFLRPKELLQ